MNYPNIKLSENLAKSFIMNHLIKNDTEFYNNQVYYTVQSKPITIIDDSIDVIKVNNMTLTESSVEVLANNKERFSIAYLVGTNKGYYEVTIKSNNKSGSKLFSILDRLRQGIF